MSQMSYILNENVLYRFDDGTLQLLANDEDDIVLLTPVINRMLYLLVSRQGEVISKEEFLEKVWDEYGRNGSTNTLSQYISTLRKLLGKYLDNSDVIITVPKQGYMFSRDIEIRRHESDVLNKVQEPAESKVDNHADIADVTLPQTKKREKSLPFAFKVSVAVLIFSLPLALAYFWPAKISDKTVYRLGDMEGCPLYSFIKYPSKDVEFEVLNIANELRERKNLDCVNNAVFYIYANANSLHSNSGSYIMLSRCINNAKNHDTCITSQTSRWQQ